jgi:hypothetical protein
MRKFFLPAFGVCAVAVLFFALAHNARAQEISATLSGNVTDATGAVIQGATVEIHNNNTNTDVRTLKTDSSGNYTATNLPAGDYTVTITDPGFRTYTANDVVLHVAEKRAVNAQLQTGALKQTVTVQETMTPVQTQSAAQSTTITGTQVRELQLNNRNFEQLVTLQPGVSSGLPDMINFGISNTSAVAVNGARQSANNWTVDGADVNDSGSNQTLLNVPSVDAIQEFTMQRSTYDAQYGRSGGGQILVATKSGTTQFHGDAYELSAITPLTQTISLPTARDFLAPFSVITISASPSAARFSLRSSIRGRSRKPSSSGPRSGASPISRVSMWPRFPLQPS